MSIRRYVFYFLPILLAAILVGLPSKSQYFKPQVQSSNQEAGLTVGRNVNMVSGTDYINGDPYLQRQNEPSMAVSTRNYFTLVAGANDYRTVDMPGSEGPLPGIPEGAAAGDAWLGLFKSFNGGESWISMLLPGHPKDTSAAGRSSPLYGFSAASDPTVRAGANGLFYYSGIAFDRAFHGRSVIFVARLIDNNVTKTGDADSIKYLDTKIIEQGTSGQFADKPWIAVDEPRNSSGTIPIYAPDTPVQNVARHSVYMAYSIFLGSLSGGDQSKIMFARSNDCGTTWQNPIKVSESQHINQGTTIAVSPQDGKIYLAWRRFASQNEPSAIMMSQSADYGNSFTKAVVVATINAFDQYSAENRFRTYAFPTLAVDDSGRVFVAWSERVLGLEGDARIVMATSTNGINWSPPQAINNHGGRGHQIMPSLTFAAGKLRMTWYDTRKSEGGYGSDISDPGSNGRRHTMDVWIAQALPSLSPTFTDFSQVSKYLHWVKTDSSGEVIIPAEIIQVEHNPPNYKLFDGGNKPFIGDYIDIAPAPVFLYDNQEGRWRFNTRTTDPSTSFIGWTDNRDVRPPSDGNWTLYNPPTAPSSTTGCSDGTRTGMRNQNIYSSHITQGIMIGAPVNTKPLINYRRTFLVFVKNLTEAAKQIRLTIESPNGMQASFWESGPPENWELPFLGGSDTWVDVIVAPYSSMTLAVFVRPYTNPYATFRVMVQEINGNFMDSIVLNPDPVNTLIAPVAQEDHTPSMMMESPSPVNLTDPTMLSQAIVYLPNLAYIQENVNPDIVTPTFRSPTFRSGNIVNPTFRSDAVGDIPIPQGKVTDLQWRVKNTSNTTSAYSFAPVGEVPTPQGGTYQLLIYRVSTTPAAGDALLTDPDTCKLYEEEHHELLLKVDTPTFRSPTFRSPTFRSPTFRSPTFRSNTFSLAPGETAVCTLRIIEPSPSSGGSGTVQSSKTLRTAGTSNGFNLNEYAKTVGGAAVSQALNPDGQIPFSSSLYIIYKVLPVAWVNDPYGPAFLEAYGGQPTSIGDNGTPNDPDDDIWKYDGKWTGRPILYPSTGMSSGLFVDVNGNIYGTPIYDPALTYPHVLSFIAAVTDNSSPTAQTAQRELEIIVNLQYHTITATAAAGGSIAPSGEVKVPHGSNATFEIKPNDCFHVEDVEVDGVPKGPSATYTFTDVRANHTIHAKFAQTIFTITAAAVPPEGGSIFPSGPVMVVCGNTQPFTVSPNDGYLLEDVLVDNLSQGAITSYTFFRVRSDHLITAKFRPLESWVRRYNNDSVNGNDEAKAIAVHKPSGNVFVTGYSTGRTTGPDAYTISYNREGTQNWSARYDGPAHLGDYGTAVAVDAAGIAFVTGYGYRGMVNKHSDYSSQKYDSLGKLVWDVQYDDRRNGNDEVTAIALDNTGFAYITGRSEDSLSKTDVKHYDYYTIKYNTNTGKVEWGARYDNNIQGADEATAIAVDSAGNVYVTGRSYGGAKGFDYATIKYDTNGIQKWVQPYDNNINGDDEATAIAVDAGGNVYVTGRSKGSGTDFDSLTIKYDSSGVFLWEARYNYPAFNGPDEASAIAIDGAGNVYVTGRSQGGATSGFDYATIKYDINGLQQWVQRYDNVKLIDEATGIGLDSAGNVYVTGRSQGSSTGFDYLTIKYDNAGKLIWRARYNNKDVNGADEAAAIGVDSAGNIYVTGMSQGGTKGLDYATVKYKQ